MQIVKGILLVIYFIVCIAIVILATIQSKDDEGLSSTITGSSTNNFYEKNKGRTRDGALKKATVLLGVFFAIGSIGLSFLYLM